MRQSSRTASADSPDWRLAGREVDHLEAFLRQVEAQGFPEQIVVVDDHDARVLRVQNGRLKRHDSVYLGLLPVLQKLVEAALRGFREDRRRR
jgi:hypothetical protein